MFIGKKRFFHEASPAEIRKGARRIIDVNGSVDNIVAALINSDSRDALRVLSITEKQPIIPAENYERAFGGPYPVEGSAKEAGWYFLRHGPEASMTQFGSQSELRAEFRRFARNPSTLPPNLELRMHHGFYFLIDQCDRAYQRAFNRGDTMLSGYTFKPVLGNDRHIRKVSLHELLDAAWITAYSEQQGAPEIEIGSSLAESLSVSRDGAIVIINSAPSDTLGKNYNMDLESVAVQFNQARIVIAYSVATTLSNHDKKRQVARAFRGSGNRSHESRDPKLDYLVAPEIAAYWKFMRVFYGADPDYLRQINKRPNLNFHFARMVPLEMCQFRMPNQSTVDFYLKMLNRVIVMYQNLDGRLAERKLTKAEQEVLLSVYVSMHKNHIWDTFYLPIGQKLQQLQWVNRPTREYQK